MKCEQCLANLATYHETIIINGDKTESHLCVTCKQKNDKSCEGCDNPATKIMVSERAETPQRGLKVISTGARDRFKLCDTCLGPVMEHEIGRLRSVSVTEIKEVSDGRQA